MSEWKEYKLGDLIETNAKSIGRGYPYSKILYLDTGSITCNKIESLQEFELSEAPSRAKRLVSGDDIIYSSVRPDQLHYGFVQDPQNNLVVSTGFVTITCNKTILYPKFLYYYLIQSQITEYLHSVAEASTSAYPSLRPSDIEALDIEIPPLEEQKRIAGVLSSLDDKIDLLNRENVTLEALAETIFRHYFIENPNPTWKEGKLGDYVKTTSGGTPSRKQSKYYTTGTIDWVKSKELNGTFIFDTEEKITEEAVCNSSAKFLPANSVLIAMYGATVGEYGILAHSMTCNQAVCALLPNDNYSYTYLLGWAICYKQDLINLATGAAQQNISQDLIKQQMVCTDYKLIRNYDEQVSPYIKKIKSNKQQILTLSVLRDSLLSRLLSGEVKVVGQ